MCILSFNIMRVLKTLRMDISLLGECFVMDCRITDVYLYISLAELPITFWEDGLTECIMGSIIDFLLFD